VNLRKDHCRDSERPEDPRTRNGRRRSGRAHARPSGPPPLGARPPRAATARRAEDTSRRGARQGTTVGTGLRPRPRGGAAPRSTLETVRLSATDISALASMKNVAKCDTWCELQNPANHRVFERKLRPRPSGRGHACLGVTHRVAPRPTGVGRGEWPPARERGGPKHGPPAGTGTASGGRERGLRAREPDAVAPGPSGTGPFGTPQGARALPPGRASRLAPRPQVRRGHPPSLSISISGGEETYEDSPSNGERTGISPA
jgi:hypothetical protein